MTAAFSRRTIPGLLAVAVGLAVAGGGRAQTEASPRTLYRCTKLTDPAKLQRCVIEGQGGREIPGELSATPKAPDAPIYPNAETPDRQVAPLSSGPP